MNSYVPQIVIDTNVLVAGMRSRRGTAFRLLSLVGSGLFEIHLSVPLVMEYEEVLRRELTPLPISQQAIDNLINYHCAVATHHEIFFLWRPFLRDQDDDMVLELAVKAACDSIVTFNGRDFSGSEMFGVNVVEPARFLQSIGALI